MIPKLFIVTGTSGTGKSSVLPIIEKQLSSDYFVYDFDHILRPYDFTDSWPIEVTNKLIELTLGNAQKGKSTICLGLIRPIYLSHFSGMPISFCLLNISVEERKKRLEKRGATIDLINDLEELENLESWIKDVTHDYLKIDTTTKSPEEVGTEIISWINKS